MLSVELVQCLLHLNNLFLLLFHNDPDFIEAFPLDIEETSDTLLDDFDVLVRVYLYVLSLFLSDDLVSVILSDLAVQNLHLLFLDVALVDALPSLSCHHIA